VKLQLPARDHALYVRRRVKWQRASGGERERGGPFWLQLIQGEEDLWPPLQLAMFPTIADGTLSGLAIQCPKRSIIRFLAVTWTDRKNIFSDITCKIFIFAVGTSLCFPLQTFGVYDTDPFAVQFYRPLNSFLASILLKKTFTEECYLLNLKNSKEYT
jgi:hypothetical protein